MKRSTVLVLVLVVVVALAAGWVATRGHSETSSGQIAPASGASVPVGGKICVVQYVSQPLLDAVYSGFRKGLEGKHFPLARIEFDNANGDATAASLLADKVCKRGCAVILALATPMAQDVKAACPAAQPILFGAITDPKSAGLVSSMAAPGANLTGTSDQWPYALQMELIAKVWGANADVGVPFNPAEANTQFAMDQIRKNARRIGLRLHEVPINTVTEASQAVDALAKRVKVIYVPADNTAVAAAPGIITAADRQDIPVVAGDPGTFKAGAVIGLGVDYSNLGILSAEQALSILRRAGVPATMPVQVSNQPELYVNEAKAAHFHVDASAVRTWYQRALAGAR